MTELDFSLPRSIMTVPKGRRVIQYVRPSSMEFGRWDAGADWSSPTSLEFEQEVLHAQDLNTQSAVSADVEVQPRVLVDMIEGLYKRASRGLSDAARVADASAGAGVRLAADHFGTVVTMTVRVKTWPAVPGVTTPKATRPEMPPRWR